MTKRKQFWRKWRKKKQTDATIFIRRTKKNNFRLFAQLNRATVFFSLPYTMHVTPRSAYTVRTLTNNARDILRIQFIQDKSTWKLNLFLPFYIEIDASERFSIYWKQQQVSAVRSKSFICFRFPILIEKCVQQNLRPYRAWHINIFYYNCPIKSKPTIFSSLRIFGAIFCANYDDGRSRKSMTTWCCNCRHIQLLCK